MLHNLKLIFIHGIDNQTTNYSQNLYTKILEACRTQLIARGLSPTTADDRLRGVVHHEVLWANLTTDLTNRYLQLAYPTTPLFWGRFTKPVDPLVIQVMQYIKDKGDKHSGPMNILGNVDANIRRIFSSEDIGEDPLPGEGHNAIIVAHSLGSVIGFDYVMGFRSEHRLHPGVSLKSFITMGSPIPLFATAMGHPDSDVVLPPNVEKWVNILSPRDGVARSLLPFFRHIPIEEHQISTRFLPTPAHTAYWHDTRTASIIASEVIRVLGHGK